MQPNPSYLLIQRENNQQLQRDIIVLSQTFLLSDTETSCQGSWYELLAQEDAVLSAVVKTFLKPNKLFSGSEELEVIQERLKEIEDAYFSWLVTLAEIQF